MSDLPEVNPVKKKHIRDEADKPIAERLYFNRDDSRIFVRRKGLCSWTMNFGNKWSWLVLVLECAAIWGVILLANQLK